MNLFDAHKKQLKLKQPVRLFEAFSGIGTQAMALKRLGVKIEHIGISEIDKHAIASYMAIHGGVKNYGNIMEIKGIDLPQIDIFTWSFPCTDLSKAGKQKGLNDTRSGLGYQVLRIVNEMEYKPKVLLMENVPDLLSEKFKDGWREMYHEIEGMGYTNHVEVLNAKDYGVAQNRERVFMVSILGKFSYKFPSKKILSKKIKDYLEEKVDNKFYLKDDLLRHIEKTGKKMKNYIEYKRYNGEFQSLCRIWFDISPTLHTKCDKIKFIDNYSKKRTFTPRECWRLMGIDDNDYDKAQGVCSNSQLYKQAGNAIVVDVLMAIFKQLF